MKTKINFSPRDLRHACAMTLPEMISGVGVGLLVLMGMAMVFASSSFSFAAIGNYMVMDRASRNALDQMSRDIRNSADLTNFTSSKLIFNYSGSTNLVYNYDQTSGQLTSWKTGDSQTNILLTGVSNLVFTVYDNVPLTGGTNATTTIPSKAKAISVAWTCAQSTLSHSASEDMQEGMIVIRNKPVF